jgi:hypothetical protein
MGVNYSAEEFRDQIIEKTGIKERARDVTCCNRVLRAIEKQATLGTSLSPNMTID